MNNAIVEQPIEQVADIVILLDQRFRYEQDVAPLFNAELSENIDASNENTLLLAFRVLLQFFDPSLEVRPTEYPHIVFADSAIAGRWLDAVKCLEKEREAIARHPSACYHQPLEALSLKNILNLLRTQPCPLTKLCENAPILIHGLLKVGKSEVYINRLIIMALLRAKRLRSVSTIVRQVASEFSVDFPLSRWPVWVG